MFAAAVWQPAIASHAEELPEEPLDTGWTLYADNDRLAPYQSDADFTAGLSLVFSGLRARDHPLTLDAALGRINRWLGTGNPAHGGDAQTYHSFGYGMAAFTPEAIRDTQPRPDQRPYACLTFLQNTRQTVVPARRASYSSTLVFGLLGTNICENLQEWTHAVVHGTRARGWSHQISDGGEPTLLWRGARQRLLYEDLTGVAHHQITWTTDAQFGYVTDLGVGVSWRWGNLRTPWWSFAPQHVEYAALGVPQIPRQPLRSGRPVQSYVWAGGMLRYRLYNALLQGQFRDSQVRISHAALEPLLAETWIGITQEFRNGYELSLSFRVRSKEFDGPGGKSIDWGSLAWRRHF